MQIAMPLDWIWIIHEKVPLSGPFEVELKYMCESSAKFSFPRQIWKSHLSELKFALKSETMGHEQNDIHNAKFLWN